MARKTLTALSDSRKIFHRKAIHCPSSSGRFQISTLIEIQACDVIATGRTNCREVILTKSGSDAPKATLKLETRMQYAANDGFYDGRQNIIRVHGISQ